MKEMIKGFSITLTVFSSLVLQSALAGTDKPDPKQLCAMTSDNYQKYGDCIRQQVPGSDGSAMAASITRMRYCQLRMQQVPSIDFNNCNSTGSAVAVNEPPYQEPAGCTQACENLKDPSLYTSGDAACDKDPACKACMQGKAGGQLTSYCTATGVTKKARTNQTISMALYGVTGVACALGCAGYTEAWAETACKALGAVTFLSDMLGLLKATELDQYAKGWVNTVSKTGSSMAGMALIGGGGAASAINGILGTSISKANIACAAGVLYLAQAAVKGVSLAKFNKSQKQNCNDIDKFLKPTNASSMILSCRTIKDPPVVVGGGYSAPSGIPNKFDFKDPSISALITDDKLGGPMKKFVENVKSNPDLMNKLNAIGQKIFEDQSMNGVLEQYASQVPALSGMQTLAGRIQNGERLTGIGDMDGSSTTYAVVGGENFNKPKSSDAGYSNDLHFGGVDNTATPQDGGEALDVGRKLASTGVVGDYLHTGDMRSLFDINTAQIHNQVKKKNIQALSPVSRLNRVLSSSRSGEREAQ